MMLFICDVTYEVLYVDLSFVSYTLCNRNIKSTSCTVVTVYTSFKVTHLFNVDGTMQLNAAERWWKNEK